MNHQFVRPVEYRVIRIVFVPSRSCYASKIRVDLSFSSFSSKVFESDHELDLKGFPYFLLLFFIFSLYIKVKDFAHYGLGIGLMN